MLSITFFPLVEELTSIAICAEVFFRALQDIISVPGDIVTAVIGESKAVSSRTIA